MQKLFLSLILLSCVVLRGEEQKIKFGFIRYFTKGQVFFIKIKYTQKQTTQSYSNGALVEEDSGVGEINYIARVLVNEVNSRGLSTSEVHEIQKANQVVDGSFKEIFDKGDSLLISNEGVRKSIKMHGKEVDKKTYSKISGFLEMNLGGPTYDDMFHDGQSHAGGESWGINKDIIVGSFKDQKVEIGADQVEGSAKMVKDKKSYILVGEFLAKGFPFLKNSSKESEYVYKVESFLHDKDSLLPFKNVKTTVQKVVVDEGTDKKIVTISKVVTTEYFVNLQDLSK